MVLGTQTGAAWLTAFMPLSGLLSGSHTAAA